MFCLTVDNFFIKYVGEQHAQHLLSTLQEHYTVTTDWEGKKYASIDPKWNYKSHTCQLTMEDYIRQLLLRYGRPAPRKSQRPPHRHRKIIYGASIQKPLEEYTSPILDAAGVKRIQGIFGTVIYHARAVNNKILATLSSIGSEQAKATQATNKAANHLLYYLATYPNYGITYISRNMILAAHFDAA